MINIGVREPWKCQKKSVLYCPMMCFFALITRLKNCFVENGNDVKTGGNSRWFPQERKSKLQLLRKRAAKWDISLFKMVRFKRNWFWMCHKGMKLSWEWNKINESLRKRIMKVSRDLLGNMSCGMVSRNVLFNWYEQGF